MPSLLSFQLLCATSAVFGCSYTRRIEDELIVGNIFYSFHKMIKCAHLFNACSRAYKKRNNLLGTLDIFYAKNIDQLNTNFTGNGSNLLLTFIPALQSRKKTHFLNLNSLTYTIVSIVIASATVHILIQLKNNIALNQCKL